MTQGYQEFPVTEKFNTSHGKLLANDKNALTLNADSAFPETTIEGMPCLRTDEKKFYQYVGGKWVVLFDYSSNIPKTTEHTNFENDLISVCKEVAG